jgi:cell division protein FtsI/penicillin-binding protein 2
MNGDLTTPGRAKNKAKPPGATVRPGTRRRIEWTFYLLLLPLFLLGWRLVQLQGLHSREAGEKESGLTMATLTQRQVLPARRADILAADGTAMAVTLDEYTVAANPRAISEKDKPKLAQLIAQNIGGDANEYSKLLQKTTRPDGSPNYYVRLARRVSEERVERLRSLIRARKSDTRKERAARKAFWEPVTLEKTPRRAYPLGNFASQLIGFTNSNGQGMDGLEWSFDKKLGGQAGEIISQVDSRGRPIPGLVQKRQDPVPGETVVTTIDPAIQAAADSTMQEIVAKYKPKNAIALVMNPKTGEIAAMATAPSFDLNNRPKNVSDLGTNRAVNFAYEPGSTFKIITAAAAVETVPGWQGKAFNCNGIAPVGGRPMRCWVYSTSQRAHGNEDLSEGIRDSCNFCMYGFARIMGPSTMKQYAEKFGIGESIEFGGLRAQPGWLAPKPQEWGVRQLASFSFGQGCSSLHCN